MTQLGGMNLPREFFQGLSIVGPQRGNFPKQSCFFMELTVQPGPGVPEAF